MHAARLAVMVRIFDRLEETALEPNGPVSLGSKYFAIFLQNLQNFANFGQARSRLYQNEILQENMRSTTFFKLYKICILLHRCNLNFLAKIGPKNQQFVFAIFIKMQQKFANVAKI